MSTQTLIPECHPERKHHAHGRCQQCYSAAYDATYRAKHRAEKVAYNAAYAAEHRAERARYDAARRPARAAYNAAHRPARAAYFAAYFADHPRTSEYEAWRSAKQRCTNAKRLGWKNYGGRGIGMAAEWLHDFAAFLSHIGLKPGPGYSLDRIDNDGDYTPGNVHWATAKQQIANRRSQATSPDAAQLPLDVPA